MFHMIWPLLLIVASNTVYHLTSKAMPQKANAFGVLTVTYLISAAVCAVLFFVSARMNHQGVIGEIKKVNWTSFVLGISLIGLEGGYIFLYRAGWKVSNGSLTANICLALSLLVFGFLLYHEQITPRQLIDVAVCAAGLILVTH